MQTYFISDGLRVKIGKSQDPSKRLSQLQTSHSAQLSVLLSIESDEEKALHQRFAQFRIRGEWFTLSPEILAFIDDPTTPYTQPPEKIKQLRVFGRRGLPYEEILRRFYDAGGVVHHLFGRRMCYVTTMQRGRYRFHWDHRYLLSMDDLVDTTTETYTLKAHEEARRYLVEEAKKLPSLHFGLLNRQLPPSVASKDSVDVEDYLRWIEASTLPTANDIHGAINQWCTFVELRASRASDTVNAFNRKYYTDHLSPLVDQFAATR